MIIYTTLTLFHATFRIPNHALLRSLAIETPKNPSIFHIRSILIEFICLDQTQLRAAELANPRECGLALEGEEDLLESRNKLTVTALYDAFNSKDVNVVHLLLAPFLEWWFHGPPTHQHLNRLLTGALLPYDSSFVFTPLSIVVFGSMVVAEGYDEALSLSWVHAWTVTDGIITQVREYYNTSVTVTRLSSPECASPSSGSCQCVWESKLSDSESVPGLVLAL